MTIYIIENYSSTGEVSGISRYNNTLFKILNTNDIEYKFVSSYFKPETVSERNFISISNKKISNIRFFLKLFVFSMRLNSSNSILHLHHPYKIFPFYLTGKNNYSILTVHDDQTLNFKRKHNKFFYLLYKTLTLFCLKRFSSLVFDNFSLAEKFNKNIRTYQKSYILNVPVDFGMFPPINKSDARSQLKAKINDKILLFVGRLELQKNPILAIDVFKKISEQLNDVKLWIVGMGSLEKELKHKIETENIKNVEFKGSISQNEINLYYSAADVFILTSLHEGGPLTVKEALVCNLPVVSTDVGDVKEVIEVIEGCYIAEPQVDDFVNKIQLALAVNNFESRSKIEKYSAENFGQRIVEIYNEIK